MSAEIKSVVANASTSVTKIWQKPFHLFSNGIYVVCSDTKAEVHVTSGTLSDGTDIEARNFGHVVKFENSLTAQAQNLGVTTWTVLYQYLVETPIDSKQKVVTFTYDADTGTFIASRPCYAAIRVDPYKTTMRQYRYTPDLSVKKGMPTITYGMAYAIVKPPTGDHQAAPLFQSCDIPAPQIIETDPGMFQSHAITMPTVVTATGEWHEPKDFDKDTYDQSNAYGAGIAGPSKDDGWVKKEVPLETGHTSLSGTKFTRNPLPNVQGPTMPVLPLTVHYAERPSEFGDDKDSIAAWKAGVGIGVTRKELYAQGGYGPLNEAQSKYKG